MCVCVCMSAHAHVCVYVSVHEHTCICMHVYVRARTNVVTFECSFDLVKFVSRFYATKHSLNLIMHKISSNFK